MRYDDLNAEQLLAVTTTDPIVAVVAGAGSGKTTVLTRRIAHLLADGTLRPHQLFAVTFTNKAAAEIRDRVEELTGINPRTMWLGTFHSLCARILRQYAHILGYTASFTIYDADDATKLLRDCCKLHHAPTEAAAVSALSDAIGHWRMGEEMTGDHGLRELVEQLGPVYLDELKARNAIDFDGLLTNVIALFNREPGAQRYYAEIFQHVLLDEAQDTCPIQFEILDRLASVHGRQFIVGDHRQAIYSWRGATLQGLMNFQANATTIYLQRNYRSTQEILNGASAVISDTHPLNAARGTGTIPRWWRCKNADEEAMRIAGFAAQRGERSCAILTRTAAQMRSIEQALLAHRVSYTVVGGPSFFERKEIKDVMAYLRVLANPYDIAAFLRVAGLKCSGFGATAAEKVAAHVERNAEYDILHAIRDHAETEARGKSVRALHAFADLIDTLEAHSGDLVSLINMLYHDSGYLELLENSTIDEDRDRVTNLGELVTFASEHQGQTLLAFLEDVALLTSVDRSHPDPTAIQLMTIHAAKGLEFDIVIVAGLDEGLLPFGRAVDEGNVDEEARLCYVAMTRAKSICILTSASSRVLWGRSTPFTPSRFAWRIPRNLLTISS